jgi:hypothetical protein
VVSGVTRFNQTGAVLFFPFRRNFHADEQRQLGLLDDRFHLVGHQLGSGFGSSLEVLDLNADGFVFVFPSRLPIICNSFSVLMIWLWALHLNIIKGRMAWNRAAQSIFSIPEESDNWLVMQIQMFSMSH